MSEAQKHYWFRPKRYGYGAEPLNWKGWLAVVGYVAIVAAITWPRMVAPTLDGSELPMSSVGEWVAIMVALTLAFVWLCWAKTDGAWRWRWGERE